MLNRHCLIRGILRTVTLPWKIYEPGKAPITVPSQFLTFTSLPPENVLTPLVEAYCKVFQEPPWKEHYSREEVVEKLSRELSGRAVRLVIMKGNQKEPVGGFCWGAVISPQEIIERVTKTKWWKGSEEEIEKLQKLVDFFKDRILFLDELAILKPFCGGLTPLQFLLRPLLELGWENNTSIALFWTSQESKIMPLAFYVGFQPLCSFDEIIFLMNPNFISLLKLAQHFNSRKAQKIISFTARLMKKKK